MKRLATAETLPAFSVTLVFPGRQPNTALSTNARRTGKVWTQKQATDAERSTALVDIRRELAQGCPREPWALRWTVHYKGLKAPDADSLGSMLKVWQDVLAAECGINDGPRSIPEVTYRVRLQSPLAPCMTLLIETTRKVER